MAAEKILVIGSTQHQGATCVAWDDLTKVNIVDFDCVIVVVASLSKDAAKKILNSTDKIRFDFARLWNSRGDIIVIGANRTFLRISDYTKVDNYFWCPVSLLVTQETGNTIDVLTSNFGRYLSQMKEWDFYYQVPRGYLTEELTKICGDPRYGKVTHELDIHQFAKNRYGRMLAGSLFLKMMTSGDQSYTGDLILLPQLNELDTRQAVNLVLMELGLPQETAPPEWAEGVNMPLVEGFQSEISSMEARIDELTGQIAAREEDIKRLDRFKKLLYASGRELEEIFAEALERCGASIEEAPYSDEEFIASHKGLPYLVECKGIGKSVARSHVLQLLGYLTKFEETEGRAGKGVLLGNAWKDLPPHQRDGSGTKIFPDNVMAMAAANNIALLSSIRFFEAFCRFLAGELSGEAILDRIFGSIGVVRFEN